MVFERRVNGDRRSGTDHPLSPVLHDLANEEATGESVREMRVLTPDAGAAHAGDHVHTEMLPQAPTVSAVVVPGVAVHEDIALGPDVGERRLRDLHGGVGPREPGRAACPEDAVQLRR
jgi:hypothetical protein